MRATWKRSELLELQEKLQTLLQPPVDFVTDKAAAERVIQLVAAVESNVKGCPACEVARKWGWFGGD